MKKLTVFFLTITFGYFLSAQTSFEFHGQRVNPGSKAHISVEISDGNQKTTLPITIFHGKEAGAVFGIVAGVHGYEYAPILAGQKLIDRIDTEQLKGTIILVQIANVESFLGRSPYVNPLDQKNLNRVFPGSAEGSITERIADYISQKVIARCDYFLDMHSGDAPEDLMPYCAYYHHDDKKEISEQGRKLAKGMGFDHIIIFNTTSKDYIKEGNPSLYCSAEAFKQGIPSLDIECGKLGIIEDDLVEKVVDAVISVGKELKMIEGVPLTSSGAIFIENRAYMSSSHTGFFYPLKSSGDYISKGMKIGYITDFFNRKLEDVYAKESGIILYMLGTPPVNEGETLVAIGQLD
ncbi:MAG: M14 family metallopeptidase [Bacteroidota bacterium]